MSFEVTEFALPAAFRAESVGRGNCSILRDVFRQQHVTVE